MITYLPFNSSNLSNSNKVSYNVFVNTIVDIRFFQLKYDHHTSLDNKNLDGDRMLFRANVTRENCVYVNCHEVFQYDYNKNEFYCIYGKETTFNELLDLGVLFDFVDIIYDDELLGDVLINKLID